MSQPRRRSTPQTAAMATTTGAASDAARLFVKAVEHHQAGRLVEAERLYRRINEVQPSHVESWSNLGLALLSRGAAAEAVAACRQALALRPDYVDALLNLAAALDASRATDEAADIYRRLIVLLPTRADLWNNFGGLLAAQGRLEQSALAFGEALKINPDFADAQFNLGRSLASLGHTETAINAYRQVVALQPDHAAAYSNLGTLLASVCKFDEAALASERAAALAPNQAEIQCNLGVALQRQGRVNEAVAAYERAVAIRPDYAAAYGNLGAGYQEQFKFDEAADALRRAIALDPNFDSAAVELIKIKRHICDWRDYNKDFERLVDLIDAKKDVVFTLLLMGFASTPAQQLACARQAMRHLNALPARLPPIARTPRADGKIRIGYLSTDFRDHPVGRLLPEMMRLHDRERFEIVGYSLGVEDNGLLRRRIRESCDRFYDLHRVSNVEAALLIQAHDIDLLVDLTGPTVGSRMEILTLRPAAAQVSFLGWPGTIGADCIDYVIADPFLVPAAQQPFYSETILHLPHCYQPSDPLRIVAEPGPTRAECGLPEDAFVFCSFNNPVKITPQLFDVWMRLLHGVENSVLWLYCKSAATIDNLTRRAAQAGIGPARIVFASVAMMDVYLARLRLADLFLDSFPYNAGATCNDALWVGLPVLTCAGETYVSRMAGSLLRAAGLPELVTHSLEEYEAAALDLAARPERLAALRGRLEAAHTTTALFDMARFTRDLEALYASIPHHATQG